MATTKPSEDSGKHAYWDSQLEPVLALHNDRLMVKTRYFNKGGPEKFGHGNVVGYHYDRRQCGLPECKLADLVLDPRGYSFCPKCFTIYNDGKPPMRAKTSDQILKASDIKRCQRNTALKKACKR